MNQQEIDILAKEYSQLSSKVFPSQEETDRANDIWDMAQESNKLSESLIEIEHTKSVKAGMYSPENQEKTRNNLAKLREYGPWNFA